MSEPQPLDWEQYIDWSQGDLLDACYDPMLQGMDLGGGDQHSAAPLEASHMKLVPEDNVSGSLSSRDQMSYAPASDENEQAATMKSDGICAACGQQTWVGTHSVYYYLVRSFLNQHARDTGHLAWACKMTGCEMKFMDYRERDAHQKTPHISGHGRVAVSQPNDCVECGERLSSKADLLRHAKELQHQPYACECGSSFSRLDVLNRHLETFGTDKPKYPCKYCKRHRGEDGFRRHDHLLQHIRNYHHHEIDNDPAHGPENSRLEYTFPVCPHAECPQYRDEVFKQQSRSIQKRDKPFSTQSAFTKHMREEHNECTFPCDVSGCSRVGRRGYFREKDLLKHRREQHPDASAYQITKKEICVRCTEPGCNDILDPSSMYAHLRNHHRKARAAAQTQTPEDYIH